MVYKKLKLKIIKKKQKQAGADLYGPAPIYHRPNGSGCVSGYGYGYGYGYGCVSVDVYVYHRPNLERARKGRLPLVFYIFGILENVHNRIFSRCFVNIRMNRTKI